MCGYNIGPLVVCYLTLQHNSGLNFEHFWRLLEHTLSKCLKYDNLLKQNVFFCLLGYINVKGTSNNKMDPITPLTTTLHNMVSILVIWGPIATAAETVYCTLHSKYVQHCSNFFVWTAVFVCNLFRHTRWYVYHVTSWRAACQLEIPNLGKLCQGGTN